MRLAAAAFIIGCTLALPASAEDVTADGNASVVTLTKRTGETCQTGITDKCKAGQPCVANLVITGPAAKALYDALKVHGAESDDVLGDYVSTKGNDLLCTIADGEYRCGVGYDVRANTLTMEQYCEAE